LISELKKDNNNIVQNIFSVKQEVNQIVNHMYLKLNLNYPCMNKTTLNNKDVADLFVSTSFINLYIRTN
jgi:hypothetical protein